MQKNNRYFPSVTASEVARKYTIPTATAVDMQKSNKQKKDELLKQFIEVLGKKPTTAELASYLGLAQSTVKNWDSQKRLLMIRGLWMSRIWE